eukprot:scaffold125183_cov27-Tisochrysis_lutea.AAC.5
MPTRAGAEAALLLSTRTTSHSLRNRLPPSNCTVSSTQSRAGSATSSAPLGAEDALWGGSTCSLSLGFLRWPMAIRSPPLRRPPATSSARRPPSDSTRDAVNSFTSNGRQQPTYSSTEPKVRLAKDSSTLERPIVPAPARRNASSACPYPTRPLSVAWTKCSRDASIAALRPTWLEHQAERARTAADRRLS